MKIESSGFKGVACVFVSVPGHRRLKTPAEDSIAVELLQNNIKMRHICNILYIIFIKINNVYNNFNSQTQARILKTFYIKAFKRFNYFNVNKNREIVEVLS